jgi:hypothetical protein
VNDKQVFCQNIADFEWFPSDNSSGVLKTCFTKFETVIDSNTFTFADRDSDVSGLRLLGSSVSFLPVEVGESFPGLVFYEAGSLSIQEISRDNFKGLKLLKYLSLYQNKLETIPEDTFKDTVSLESIVLCEFRESFFVESMSVPFQTRTTFEY